MGDPAGRHPWHPVLVHFPIAFWIAATLLDALLRSPVTVDIPGIEGPALSHLLLWSGTALALPTVVAGVIDYLRLPRPVREGVAVTHHLLWMASAWTIFLIAGVFRIRSGEFAVPAAWPILLAEASGAVCVVFGGRAAARVVYEELVATGRVAD